MIIDRYTKFVLTVIAAALVVIAARPIFEPRPAIAQRGIVQVDLVQVGGSRVGASYQEPINVRIDN